MDFDLMPESQSPPRCVNLQAAPSQKACKSDVRLLQCSAWRVDKSGQQTKMLDTSRTGCDADLCVGPAKVFCYPVVVRGPGEEDFLWVILMEIEIKNPCEIPIRALPWEQGICTQKRSSWDSPLQLLLQRGSRQMPKIHLASAW